MNHPLGAFHRPRPGAGLRDAARGQTLVHRRPPGVWLAEQSLSAEPLIAPLRPAKPASRSIVAPFAPPLSSEKPRRHWYQYSLRTLLLLTLVVSLFMSWHAVKLKKAMAQKKAVEAILAAHGAVDYDYQFDEKGDFIKGATGRGPAWLRNLLGPDYIDTVVHVSVSSKAGVQAVNGLVALQLLSVDVAEDGEDPLKQIQDIDGLEGLEISGHITDAVIEHVRGLRRLRRLKLHFDLSSQGAGQAHLSNPKNKRQLTNAGLAALQSCPNLRELIVECRPGSGLLPAAILGSIENLSQLEKLSMCNVISEPPFVLHIDRLAALRQLEFSNWSNTADEIILTFGGFEHIQHLSRLAKLTLSTANLSSSDIKLLSTLRALRELDLSGCSNIDNTAVPFLQTMTGLRSLRLRSTGITDEGAESIDDALPNCRVIYGSEQ